LAAVCDLDEVDFFAVLFAPLFDEVVLLFDPGGLPGFFFSSAIFLYLANYSLCSKK
jgi:hypothetical protein